jgi:hypothetical protein
MSFNENDEISFKNINAFKFAFSYFLCMLLCFVLPSLGVSAADIATILQQHNTYRGGVSPPATNMLKMVSQVISFIQESG